MRTTRRGRIVLRAVATLLVVGGGGAVVTEVRADAAASKLPTGTTRVATPLLSPRRAPTAVAEEAALQVLDADLGAVLAPYDACGVVRAASGATIAHEPARALAPASTAKLLTAAAALARLGPDHRFVTGARSAAPLAADGTLTGDLVLVGGGDPVLSTPEYEAARRAEPRHRDDPVTRLADLADTLTDAGLRRIDGAVLGDDARHESLRYLPVWEPDYDDQGAIGALSALTVDDADADFPGHAPASDPAAHAAAQLARLLAERGVTVAAGSGHAPAGAAAATTRTLGEVASPPLATIVAGMLRSSDNQTAEMLVRELAVAARGLPGTTAAGVTVIADSLAGLGVPLDDARLLDGSGLARGDRLRCTTLVAVLGLAGRDGFAALHDGLALAGRTGTLAERLTDAPVVGRVRAKTGQLEGVAGLAGVVDEPERLEFATLVNGSFPEAVGREVQAAVATVVASFPAVPAELVPAP